MKKRITCTRARKATFLLLTIFLILNGCASIYQPLPKPYPKPQQRSLPAPSLPGPTDYEKEAAPEKREPASDFTARTGPAAPLYHEARAAMKQGHYTQAELALERALRMEPSNGYYWYAMGELKYRQNASSQAINFCLKSKSLAGQDKQLIRLNNELIQMAK